MPRAKYYIYRNLRENLFSIKHKGIVIDRQSDLVLFNVKFQVSEKGRQRVINSKRKNVHAYAVCDGYQLQRKSLCANYVGITYNPHLNNGFIQLDTKAPVFKADVAYLLDGHKILVPLNALYAP